MTMEHVGPGGVSNAYGVRTTTPKQLYSNSTTYQDVFIETGTVPTTTAPQAQIPTVTNIVYSPDGKVTSWVADGNSYSVTYGADGITAVYKNGQVYQTVTYDSNGNPTSVIPT